MPISIRVDKIKVDKVKDKDYYRKKVILSIE